MPHIMFHLDMLTNFTFPFLIQQDSITFGKRSVMIDLKQNHISSQQVGAMVSDLFSCAPPHFSCLKLLHHVFRYSFFSMSSGAIGPKKTISLGNIAPPNTGKRIVQIVAEQLGTDDR